METKNTCTCSLTGLILESMRDDIEMFLDGTGSDEDILRDDLRASWEDFINDLIDQAILDYA